MIALLMSLMMSGPVPTNGRWINAMSTTYGYADFWSIANLRRTYDSKNVDIWVRLTTFEFDRHGVLDTVVHTYRESLDCTNLEFSGKPAKPETPEYVILEKACNTFYR